MEFDRIRIFAFDLQPTMTKLRLNTVSASANSRFPSPEPAISATISLSAKTVIHTLRPYVREVRLEHSALQYVPRRSDRDGAHSD